MDQLGSLQDVRSEILIAAQAAGNATLQTLVDQWFNEECENLVQAYDFPELMTTWHAPLPVVSALTADVRGVGQTVNVGLQNKYTGIAVESETTEDPALTATVTYWDTLARTSTVTVTTAVQISQNPVVLFAGVHYGIVSVSINQAALAQITFENVAATIAYAIINPWMQAWAPFELSLVPRNIVVLKKGACFLRDTSLQATQQNKYALEVIPSFEMERAVGQTNPPNNSRPSKICLRRRDAARENIFFDPRVGDNGIAVVSSTTENATLEAQVTYYADADRTDIRKAWTTTTISNIATTLVSGQHFGIISCSVNQATAGRITFQNVPATNLYATLLPWERAASFPVIGFNSMPDRAGYELHLTYKQGIEYMSRPSDTPAPLPPSAKKVAVAWTKSRAMKQRSMPEWQAQMVEAQRLQRELVHSYRFTQNDEPRVFISSR